MAKNITLGVPGEMNIVDICRGMQTGWPQLVRAMEKLMNDPQFCNTYSNSYAAGRGLLIGRPQQTLAALMVDPGWLTKPSPPQDVYAWCVWLTMRVYEAAKTISSTLQQLPGLISAAGKANPGQAGTFVQEVLSGQYGLSATAENIVQLATDFADHLKAIGGNLDEAQAAYQQMAAGFEEEQLPRSNGNMMGTIAIHPRLVARNHELNAQLDTLQGAAAQVTVFAVIANMTLAIQSSITAWKATADQFKTIAGYGTDKLGDAGFLESSLNLTSAVNEWKTFAGVIQKYMGMALLVR